jgi:hypothetical protein
MGWDLFVCLFVGFAQKGRDYETMGSFQLVQYFVEWLCKVFVTNYFVFFFFFFFGGTSRTSPLNIVNIFIFYFLFFYFFNFLLSLVFSNVFYIYTQIYEIGGIIGLCLHINK